MKPAIGVLINILYLQDGLSIYWLVIYLLYRVLNDYIQLFLLYFFGLISVIAGVPLRVIHSKLNSLRRLL